MTLTTDKLEKLCMGIVEANLVSKAIQKTAEDNTQDATTQEDAHVHGNPVNRPAPVKTNTAPAQKPPKPSVPTAAKPAVNQTPRTVGEKPPQTNEPVVALTPAAIPQIVEQEEQDKEDQEKQTAKPTPAKSPTTSKPKTKPAEPQISVDQATAEIESAVSQMETDFNAAVAFTEGSLTNIVKQAISDDMLLRKFATSHYSIPEIKNSLLDKIAGNSVAAQYNSEDDYSLVPAKISNAEELEKYIQSGAISFLIPVKKTATDYVFSAIPGKQKDKLAFMSVVRQLKKEACAKCLVCEGQNRLYVVCSNENDMDIETLRSQILSFALENEFVGELSLPAVGSLGRTTEDVRTNLGKIIAI